MLRTLEQIWPNIVEAFRICFKVWSKGKIGFIKIVLFNILESYDDSW